MAVPIKLIYKAISRLDDLSVTVEEIKDEIESDSDECSADRLIEVHAEIETVRDLVKTR